MRSGKVLFRAFLIVSLALAGVCVGNRAGVQAIPATNTLCTFTTCDGYGLDGDPRCKAGFKCKSSYEGSDFWGCVNKLTENCSGNRNKFGYTGCPATCQDGVGEDCPFEVDHCQ